MFVCAEARTRSPLYTGYHHQVSFPVAQHLHHKSQTDVTSLKCVFGCIQTKKCLYHDQVDFKHHMRSGSPPSSFQILQQTQSGTFSLHNEALCFFGGDAVFVKFSEASLFSTAAPPPVLPAFSRLCPGSKCHKMNSIKSRGKSDALGVLR